MPFAGRPCIQWAIDAALGCSRIDDIVVSTDDPRVSELVSENKDLKLIHRLAHLAQGASSTVDVVRHALEVLADRGQDFQ